MSCRATADRRKPAPGAAIGGQSVQPMPSAGLFPAPRLRAILRRPDTRRARAALRIEGGVIGKDIPFGPGAARSEPPDRYADPRSAIAQGRHRCRTTTEIVTKRAVIERAMDYASAVLPGAIDDMCRRATRARDLPAITGAPPRRADLSAATRPDPPAAGPCCRAGSRAAGTLVPAATGTAALAEHPAVEPSLARDRASDMGAEPSTDLSRSLGTGIVMTPQNDAAGAESCTMPTIRSRWKAGSRAVLRREAHDGNTKATFGRDGRAVTGPPQATSR